MKKRIIPILLLIFIMLFTACGGGNQQAGENLLQNPGFEAGTGTDVEGWVLDRYDTAPPIEYYQVKEDSSAPEGKNVIKIESTTFNDARFIQQVKVEPDSYYCLSAMIKTEHIEQRSTDSGAHIGFLQTNCKSGYYKSNTSWTKVTVYGKTDSETKSVNVSLRLGDYSADALGVVYFDDVSLTKIDKLPDGVSALSMATFQFAQPEEDSGKIKTDKEIDQVEKDQMINVLAIGIVIFIIFFAVLFWAYREFNFKMSSLYVFVIIALVIRLVAAVIYKGFEVDIGCFALWGDIMADRGIANFYSDGMFCDYPPLYMIVLGIVSSIADVFSVDLQQGIGLAFLKAPAIICDAVAAVMIAHIAKKHLGEKLGVILGVAYAFLPTAILNSAIWGQVDSVLVLFMLITFWLIDNDQFGFSVLTFAVGLLFKPQAILFGPIMLLVAIHEFYVIYLDFTNHRKQSGKMRLIKGFGGLIISVLIFVLLSLIMRNGQSTVPFELTDSITIEVDWLLGKYLTTLGSYDYATLSSFGIMGLLDGQWIPSETEVFNGVTYGQLGTALLVFVGLLVVGIFVYLMCNINKQGKKAKKDKTLDTGWFWLLAALMVAGAVTVSTRTHERYMFPVILMMLMSFVHFKDIRLLAISAGYAFLNYVNVAGLLFVYEETKKYDANGFGRYFANGSVSFWDALFDSSADAPAFTETVFVIGSLLTVVLFIYQIYVTINILSRTKKEINTLYIDDRGKRLFERRSYNLPKVKKADVIICLVITAVYACFAFNGLGDVKAAQNYWYADKSEVYAVADLGEVKDFDSIKYLSKSGNMSTVKFSVSEDGENYSLYQSVIVGDTSGWKSAGDSGKARYIKIEATSNVSIDEVVVLKDNVPLEIKATDQKVVPCDIENALAISLFDEQELYTSQAAELIPQNKWESGGNYIVWFDEPISFYNVDAYVSVASDVVIAIPSQVFDETTGEMLNNTWTDIIEIKSMEEGWAQGTFLMTDEYMGSVDRILIKNANKTVVSELKLLSDQDIKIVAITDENSQSIAEDHDVYNCFDEKHVSRGEIVTLGATWRVTSFADYVVADFGELKNIAKAYYRTSLSEGSFEVYFSEDGQNWVMQNTLSVEKSNLYYWHNLPVSGSARYVLITAESPFLKLIEIGFFESSEAQTPIPIKNLSVSNTSETGGKNLFDEQDLVPAEGATYMNSMYFDEIYHARTAYESANGHSIYEWTHPPLGKDMMSWCVSIMGMTPFAWRFAGTLAGVLMIPAMYFLGLLMFKKTSWATVTALLMACDGMHYAQTRLATIDSFGVLFIILMFLFMLWYYNMSFYDKPLWKTFIPLGLCGLSFGLGAASKWICLYAGAGLAIIFFITVFRRWSEYDAALREVNKTSGEKQQYLNHVIHSFHKNTGYTILFCIGAFIVVPLIIYCLSYYPYWNAEGETREWYKIILDNQKAMFDYHSKLEATHPYQSAWYTWPLMETPMFYYAGKTDSVNMSAIYAFGNPLIWITGLICTLGGIALFCKRLVKPTFKAPKKSYASNKFLAWFGTGDENELDVCERDTRTLIFILLGIACNLIPWIGISRCIFIYHYFATVPFIMLFTVYVLRHLARYERKTSIVLTVLFVIAVAIVFVMFLPMWTGTSVSKDFVDTWLRWMPTWFGYYFPQG